MNLEYKTISREFIPKALEKAEKYRFMNHPKTSESICRDVLEVDPGNQDAVILLILSITEQFSDSKRYNVKLKNAQQWLPELKEEYLRLYLSGLILERWAKARSHDLPGPDIYEFLAEAMEFYRQAEPIRPSDDESCLLHHNFCVRFIERHPHIKPRVVTEDTLHAHNYGDAF